MAELKMQDFPYELDGLRTDATEVTVDTTRRPEIVVVPQSPARRLKSISKMEKVIVSILLLSIIALSLITINLRTNISQVEHDISVIQSEVSQNKNDAIQLEQEKSELSKNDRIQKIAESLGLSINDDNLRKVK